MPRLVAIALVSVAATGLWACADAPPTEPQPIVATDSGQGFDLVLRAPKDRFDASEVVEIGATLTWTGPGPKATIWSGDPGPVVFSIAQIDGRLEMGGAVSTICMSTELARGVPLDQPYVKSVGYSNDDPDAGLYRAFAADPVLHLLPGRWRVTAEVDGLLAECAAEAPRLGLRASAEIVVE